MNVILKLWVRIRDEVMLRAIFDVCRCRRMLFSGHAFLFLLLLISLFYLTIP
jgi:hypothetical protein